MARPIPRRMTADIDGDFVVFLIGMRINKPWKPWKWLPPFLAMPRMLRELSANPDTGFLGAQQYFGSPLSPMVAQYWRSFEHLERYAKNRDAAHWPAWVRFNRSVASNGDVGIWHETYLVPAGGYECIYNNMPPTGLACFSKLVTVGEKRNAASERLAKPHAAEARLEDSQE